MLKQIEDIYSRVRLFQLLDRLKKADSPGLSFYFAPGNDETSIRKKLSALAMPQEIEFVDSLPKTRSGKIMRRVLRAKEWGEEIGDISTLENDM